MNNDLETTPVKDVPETTDVTPLTQTPEMTDAAKDAIAVTPVGVAESQSVDTAKPTLSDGTVAALREAEIRLTLDIAQTLSEMGESAQEDRQRLIEMANDLRDMFFLVVIIGEFNAGKSSFINALLGEELLPMGITPTTEAIELIKYGDATHKPTIKQDNLREWTHPNMIAPGVALVDTPGTGSVFQRHERTAKAFLHRSDLIIFVLSAKRALADTERLYLELAKSYGKKVILVVNQVDLVSPQERVDVRRFVERQVKDLLDLQPLLFMVSAKEALTSRASGVETGGVDAVRAHLRGVFSEAPPARQKLIAQLDTVTRIVEKYGDQIKGKGALVSNDTSKVHDVENELTRQSAGLNTQLKAARADIDTIFEGIRQRGLQFMSQNLSLRKIGRGTNREKLQAEFQETVIGNSLHEIQDATQNYVNALIDQSRLYWRGVIDRLNQLQDTLESEISGLDASVYAEQREALQDAIRAAESEMRSYSSGRVLGEMEQDFKANMAGFTSSTAATAVGLIVALAGIAAQGPVVGAGAAALALPAVLIGAPVMVGGGYFMWRYYRRITTKARDDFNQRVDQLENTYHAALDDLTKKERDRLAHYGRQVLTPIYSRLEALSQRYKSQEGQFTRYVSELATLRDGVQSL
jgi:small GTP-binding protein